MSDTLRVRNWDKWQSYRKDRGQPPWIKVHRQLMRDPNWVELTDAQRGQLVAIWMLAADRDGQLPNSPATIKKLCYMESEPDLKLFIRLGFIDGCQGDANVTPDRRQADALEESRGETEENRCGADAPAAAVQPMAYAWSRNVIHLKAKDYDEWKRSFSYLDLDAELVARDEWLSAQPREVQRRWFPSTSKYLANRNMEAKAKSQAPPNVKRSPFMEAFAEIIEEADAKPTSDSPRLGIESRHRGDCPVPESG